MISLTVRDKRYGAGFHSVIFQGNEITKEVYDYVKKHKNAYLISGYEFFYIREEFLKKYSKEYEK